MHTQVQSTFIHSHLQRTGGFGDKMLESVGQHGLVTTRTQRKVHYKCLCHLPLQGQTELHPVALVGTRHRTDRQVNLVMYLTLSLSLTHTRPHTCCIQGVQGGGWCRRPMNGNSPWSSSLCPRTAAAGTWARLAPSWSCASAPWPQR